ncbi:S-adenosyl-L-methionine-dependent methyltransferase [Astrocystis sublimbata]|nr:S-adenosyl-L-methionine-dependent methyltransferase [Astrocystis sublimbata]
MASGSEQPKLPKLFEDILPEEHSAKWDKLWKDNVTPWDRGAPSMALHDLLTENPNKVIPLPNKDSPRTALVPGCGRGYDVVLLSSLGYNVYGLDVSSQALNAAKENTEKILDNDVYKTEGIQRGVITWIRQDFFAEKWEGVQTPFDLIFDYTFFCALSPPMRPAWASKMKSLLGPSGRLVCLEFPSEKTLSEKGPPWAAPPTEYLGYLSNPGLQPRIDESGGIVVEDIGSPAPGGLKRLLHMKPRRTHEGGMKEGRVQDCISVWAHASE